MATITVNNNGISKKISYSQGESLLAILQNSNIVIDAPCGGNGICGKCNVIVKGEQVKACRYYPEGDIEADITPVSKDILVDSIDIKPCCSGLGLAVDIGTTTVAAYLYDLKNGKCLKQTGEKNRQSAYGSDVISRIAAVSEVGVARLSNIIRTQIVDMASSLTNDIGMISKVSIAGNTVMEHLFAGLSPESIGKAPFTPLCYFGETLEEEIFEKAFADRCQVYLAPAVSGYVGGDITAGMLYTKIADADEKVLLIDIGTNGEMVLGDKNGFISCATAAGPVFDAGTLWGSSLIDAVADLLQKGVIDDTGRIESGNYRLDSGTVLEAAVVREVQLGKAAIRTGIEVLLRKAGLAYDDVSKVYLAGGFGNYMNTNNACAIGMIPIEFRDRIVRVGNTAGKGAAMLLDETERSIINELVKKISYEELSSSQLFNELFIDNISFD